MPEEPSPPAAESEDSHLRGANEIAGWHIQALDHDFGHIEDLVFEETSWAIRYLVADTRNWWPGKHVLLSPDWISWVSWSEQRVYADLDRETVRRAPAFDPSLPITRQYEEQLFDYYNRQGYWQRQPEVAKG
jgi:hypothetical protein